MTDLTLAIKLQLAKEQFDANWKAAVGSIQSGGRAITGAVDPAAASVDRLRESVRHAGHRMVEMYSAAQLVQAGLAGVRAVAQAGMGLEALNSTLKFATGSSEGAAEALAFVRGEAERLGIPVTESARAFAKLAAAAKGTRLEGQGARDIFSAVAEAGRVMGLSSDEQSGALLAVSQMMSKGTVSAEELRGQLGERLPGAFQVAARAMGVTTAELGKMLEEGKVVADDFLPRFAAELRKSVGEALPAATQTFAAQIDRLKNKWQEILELIARSGALDALAGLVGKISADIERLAASGELKAMAEEAAAAIASLAAGIGKLSGFLIEHGAALAPLLKGYLQLRVAVLALDFLKPLTGLAQLTAGLATASGAAGRLAALAAAPLTIKVALVIAGLEALKYLEERLNGDKREQRGYDQELIDLRARTSEYAGEVIKAEDAVQALGEAEFARYQQALKGAEAYYRVQAAEAARRGDTATRDEMAEQANLYADHLERFVEGEKLRRRQVELTGTILAKEAQREKLLAGEVRQTREEAIKEQIKGYEALAGAIAKAREEAQKEAEGARKKAADLREQAGDKKLSAADKATQIREKDLSSEDKQARDWQRAVDAQQQGDIAAAKARLAQMNGREEDFEKYAKEAEKFLGRAMKFAENAGDANLVEEIGGQQAGVDAARAKAEDSKAAEAETRATGLMDQLNTAQAKLKELQGEAATIQVNAEIAGAINKLAEVETKLAALHDKTVTVTVNTVQAGAPAAAVPAADAGPLPTLAYGGPLPGHAPHDRADNMLYWGTPGEWVIQRPAARYYGAAFMAALNAMRLPKFALGGQIGGSAIDRLRVPALTPVPSPRGPGVGSGNLTLDFGELGKVTAQAGNNTQREIERVFTRAALARGRR